MVIGLPPYDFIESYPPEPDLPEPDPEEVYPPLATRLTRTEPEVTKMEKDFFELYTRHELLALEVGHNSVAGWNIYIYDRRGKEAGNWGDAVIHVQGCDRKLVFAEAYTKLAEYFSGKLGGY